MCERRRHFVLRPRGYYHRQAEYLYEGYSERNIWRAVSKTSNEEKNTGLFKKNEPILLRNILLKESNTKLQPSHKYSTHNQLLFPVLQVFNVATTCSTGNINAIREFLPGAYQHITMH